MRIVKNNNAIDFRNYSYEAIICKEMEITSRRRDMGSKL